MFWSNTTFSDEIIIRQRRLWKRILVTKVEGTICTIVCTCGLETSTYSSVKENWETVTNRLKKGLEEQDEVLAPMEKDLASKEEEITDLNLQVEKLLQDSEKVKELSKENEDLDEQCERLKIKVINLLTNFFRLWKQLKQVLADNNSVVK